jgi:hypothetical protein
MATSFEFEISFDRIASRAGTLVGRERMGPASPAGEGAGGGALDPIRGGGPLAPARWSRPMEPEVPEVRLGFRSVPGVRAAGPDLSSSVRGRFVDADVLISLTVIPRTRS